MKRKLMLMSDKKINPSRIAHLHLRLLIIHSLLAILMTLIENWEILKLLTHKIVSC